MRVEGGSISPALRLVGSVEPSQVAASTDASTSAVGQSAAPDATDSLSFESAHAGRLPNLPIDVTQAMRRIEQIRRTLVAARVNLAMQFDSPVARRPVNPYAHEYPRLIADAGQLNAQAVRRLAERA